MLDFLIVLICLSLNAFFSAYEMAFVTVSNQDINDMGSEKSSLIKRLSYFKKKPERTLSVIQIGITLVGAIAAAVGGTGAVESLEPYLVAKFAISKTLGEFISVISVIIPLTYFTVVFGELLPKTIALRHPKRVLSLGTRTLALVDKFLSPIVTFLELSTSYLLKKLKLYSTSEWDEEEGSFMIDVGALPTYHKTFVQNLVSMKAKRVREAMVEWNDVCYLNFSDSEEEIKHKISHKPYSRYPVVDGAILVGLLHIKEFHEAYREPDIPWESLIRPMITVHEKEKILEVFLKMQKHRYHLAMVIDSEGAFLGIVSLEDILEEIVGDIQEDVESDKIARLLSRRSGFKIKNS